MVPSPPSSTRQPSTRASGSRRRPTAASCVSSSTTTARRARRSARTARPWRACAVGAAHPKQGGVADAPDFDWSRFDTLTEDDWLAELGVRVTVLDDEECVTLLGDFVAEHPAIWNEDIGEELP